ncbi:MAG: hypothetical protein ACR2QV_01315, partial [Gammaproteobacteria bacterium]
MTSTVSARNRLAVAAMVLLAVAARAEQVPYADYTLELGVDPMSSRLEATAEIELPEASAGRTVEFLLTSAVEITAAEPPVERVPLGAGDASGVQGFTGINGSSVELDDSGHAVRYRVTLPDGDTSVRIEYSGAVNFALGDLKEQYTRGFRSTAGIIGNEGVYLAGSSLWYPYFSSDLVTFWLTSNVPEGWHLISQGNGSSRDDSGTTQWDSAGPVDEIYLVGGPLVRYAEAAGAVSAEVFLHEPDD